jgi:hypothetical protein
VVGIIYTGRDWNVLQNFVLFIRMNTTLKKKITHIKKMFERLTAVAFFTSD